MQRGFAMTHDLHRRMIRIKGLDLHLSGVAPDQARDVAAALPAALTAALARGIGGVPPNQDLRLTGASASDMTHALACEIAARIRARIDRPEDR